MELLRVPTFAHMINLLTVKEAVIVSLRLGYTGNYYSSEEIAEFLKIEVEEVIEATRKALILYKDNFNQLIDTAVQVLSQDTQEVKRVREQNSN